MKLWIHWKRERGRNAGESTMSDRDDKDRGHDQDQDHDRDSLARAILIAGEQISSALQQVAIAELQVARAINALVPPAPPPPKATSLTLRYKLQGGVIMGTPVSGIVGQVYDPTVVESNSTTPSIQPIGPLVYASDNTAAVTVDPATGIATLVAAGTANVSALDQGNGLTDTVAFTVSGVTPPVATALSLSYALAAAQKRR